VAAAIGNDQENILTIGRPSCVKEPLKNCLTRPSGIQFTHKGVGSLLLQRVEQWARALGATRVSLADWAFNESAAQFFLKTGYETYNIKMWKNL
jgi:histone acetyltransferase (RNA polymerase elongator complex component)